MPDFRLPGTEIEEDTLHLLRRAGLERHELGERLARHEFQSLKHELQTGKAFDLRIELAPVPAATPETEAGGIDPDYDLQEDNLKGLAMLPVPLGRIAWTKKPEDLPVTGILVEPMTGAVLSAALLSLLSEHHTQPFARFVFLCRTLDPVHVLGRYGFLCHFCPSEDLRSIGQLMTHRYRMSQIRNLIGGAKLWDDG